MRHLAFALALAAMAPAAAKAQLDAAPPPPGVVPGPETDVAAGELPAPAPMEPTPEEALPAPASKPPSSPTGNVPSVSVGAQPPPGPPAMAAGSAPVCSSGSPNSASAPPPPVGFGFTGMVPALGELTRPAGRSVLVGLSLEKVGRDLLLDTLLLTTFDLGPVQFGLQAPLRWRVYDFDQGASHFNLRKQDWDEVSDYLRILRYVQYGAPKAPLYARLGELSGTTLGHGTLVNWYYNAIDVNHWQAGARFNVNVNAGGVETMLQSLSSPHLVGGRAFVRPWYFIDRCSPLYALALGASAFVDADAPTTLQGATVDASDRLHARGRALAVYGLDAEYPIVASKLVDLTPYSDLNFIGGEGAGFHTGLLVGVHPPGVDLQGRLEYRHLGTRYLPAYFDSFYEVQRFSFRHGKTKLQYLDEGGAGSPLNGAYAELVVGVGKLFSVLVAYEDYQGPNNSSLQLRILLPELVGLRLGGYYLKRDFGRFAQLFDRDNALGVLEARYQIGALISVVGQIGRQWELESDGTYRTTDLYSFGVQVLWAF